MTRIFALLLAVISASAPVMAQERAVGFGGGLDRSAPVEVAADSLEVDQATGRALLRGNVLIVQDMLRLSAGTVEIAYSEVDGTRKIQQLIADTDVLIVAGPDAAEGQRAVYTLGSGEIEMSGDVMLTQGESTLAGERLTVNLETGVGVVSGRVRTTFGSVGAN